MVQVHVHTSLDWRKLLKIYSAQIRTNITQRKYRAFCELFLIIDVCVYKQVQTISSAITFYLYCVTYIAFTDDIIFVYSENNKSAIAN